MTQEERVVELFVVAVKAHEDRWFAGGEERVSRHSDVPLIDWWELADSHAELAFAYPEDDHESSREFCESVTMVRTALEGVMEEA
ncbi:hypothetical protein PybrP1_010472 [[Pythium] brassicae (nom. inval.)]|nr:hypothetical protein PybrP1_010472 [[Pythium] brassicae (nom. inval.)]